MTKRDDIRALLREGKTARDLIDGGHTSSVVYAMRKELIDAGEIGEDTVAPEKRIARPKPQAVEAEVDEGGGFDGRGARVPPRAQRRADRALRRHVDRARSPAARSPRAAGRMSA